ncbi:secreted protein, partial [Candidatus Thiomargarita nelsonii]
MRHLRWLSPVLLGLIIFNTWAAPEDTVQFYFNNYGRADSEDKLVRRVHKIFEQV